MWGQNRQRSLPMRLALFGTMALVFFDTASGADAQQKPDAAASPAPPATSSPPRPDAVPAASQAPSGQQGSASLPTVTVEGQRPRPARHAKAAPRRAPAVAPSRPSPAPAETATGPVRGYVATQSATATKTATPLIETPQAVSVVTRDQIEAQAAQNLPQAVRYTSGVFSETTGADGRFENVYIRGFLADQYLDSTKLLVGSFALPQIEIYNLERIEILHGPASVLYGQASPGGLIDMVSKRPTADPFNEIVFQAGNYDRIQGAFDSSGPIDRNGQFLYRISGLVRDTDTQVNYTEYQRVSVAPSFTWRPDPNTTFTILTGIQEDPKGGFFNELPAVGTALFNPHGMIPTSFFSGQPNFDFFDRKQYYAGYVFEHRFDDIWTVRQNFRFMNVDVNTATTFPTSFQANLTTLNRSAFTASEQLNALTVDNQAEAKFRTGPLLHTTLLGIDYQRATDRAVDGSGPAPSINAFAPVYSQLVATPPTTTNTNQVTNQLGFYAQDQLKLGNWIALLGGRWDQAAIDTDNFLSNASTSQSPSDFTRRAALLYHFDLGVAPYVQYTESFQPTLGTDFNGNAFKPTTGQQEEIGIKVQPDGWKVFGSVAVFNLVERNVLTPDPNHLNFNVQTGAIGSQGIEIEGKATLAEGLSLTAAYTHLNLKVLSANDGTQGLRPVAIPTDTASLWGDYTFHHGSLAGFGFGSGVRYLGPSAGNTMNTFYLPGATLFDSVIHYDFSYNWPQLKGLYLAVNATNVFDHVYVQLCQNAGCYYGLRRTVIGTLRYRF
jgi:iron complex outermembrane recepter protein